MSIVDSFSYCQVTRLRMSVKLLDCAPMTRHSGNLTEVFQTCRMYCTLLSAAYLDTVCSFRVLRSWSDNEGWGYPMFSMIDDPAVYPKITKEKLR